MTKTTPNEGYAKIVMATAALIIPAPIEVIFSDSWLLVLIPSNSLSPPLASRPNPRNKTRYLVAISGKKKPDPIQTMIPIPIMMLRIRDERLTFCERIPAAILSPPKIRRPAPARNKNA